MKFLARLFGSRSSDLRQWFGNSVVRDGRGKPLLVYRGQHGSDTQGLRTRAGSITFTSDRETAQLYARQPNNTKLDGAHGANPHVIAAYLRITNPIINSEDPFVDLKELVDKLGEAEARRIALKFSERIEETNNWEESYSDFKSVKDLLQQQPEALQDLYFQAYWWLDDRDEVERLKQKGFDGAIHMGSGASLDDIEYKVFSPDQVRIVEIEAATQESAAAIPLNSLGEPVVQDPKHLKNFRAWFRRSKVVDAQRRPLVVYHGSPSADIILQEGFDPKRIGIGNDQYGSGFYFTSNKANAEGYKSGGVDRSTGERRKVPDHHTAGVLSVYLSLQNPIRIQDGGHGSIWEKFPPLSHSVANSLIRMAPDIKARDPDGSISNFGDVRTEGWDRLLQEAIDQYTGGNPWLVSNDFYDGHESEFLRLYSNLTGYDGVITSTGIYVAWFPEQIKAVDNFGDFDANNPSIMAAIDQQLPLDASQRSRGWADDLGNDDYLVHFGNRPAETANRSYNSVGEPIHKTPEGIVNFWRWFRDSKTVDSEGRPLVLYHGTMGQFTRFHTGEDDAIYFTPHPDVAEFFSENNDRGWEDQIGPRVMACYVRIRKPKVLTDAQLGELIGDGKNRDWTAMPEVIAEARQEGYDGMHLVNIRGDTDHEYGDQWLAFSPAQVKSATDNDGSFGRSNDITAKQPDTNSLGIVIHPKPEGIRNFWRWFGRSKVVDDQGRPLVLFHGTTADFKEFERGHPGGSVNETNKIGLWFTNDAAVAGDFARRTRDVVVDRNPSSGEQEFWPDGDIKKFLVTLDEVGHIMPVYIRMENPKIFVSDDKTDAFEAFMDWRDQWAVYIGGERGSWRQRYVAIEVEKTNRELEAALRREGYDGIIIQGTHYDSLTDEPINQYVVFDANQIKSAIGNDGSFGRGNDITAQRFVNSHSLEHEKQLDAVKEQLKREFPGLDFWLSTGSGDWHLGKVAVPKGERRRGLGTRFMERLCELADEHGAVITLTPAQPSDGWGTTSYARLVKFYQRFDFQLNKGRHADYRYSGAMIRKPSAKQEAAISVGPRTRDFLHSWTDGSNRAMRLVNDAVVRKLKESVTEDSYTLYRGWKLNGPEDPKNPFDGIPSKGHHKIQLRGWHSFTTDKQVAEAFANPLYDSYHERWLDHSDLALDYGYKSGDEIGIGILVKAVVPASKIIAVLSEFEVTGNTHEHEVIVDGGEIEVEVLDAQIYEMPDGYDGFDAAIDAATEGGFRAVRFSEGKDMPTSIYVLDRSVLSNDLKYDSVHQKDYERTGFWGRQGAGALVLAQTTGRFLINHRSRMVLEPGTWGTWGGAVDPDVDIEDAVRRELQEEAGLDQPVRLEPLLVFEKGSFRYHNFLAIVKQEFEPQLNWESQGFAWVEFGDWPQPLHPGLKALLSDRRSVQIMQRLSGSTKDGSKPPAGNRPKLVDGRTPIDGDSRYAYHITAIENLESIREEGLQVFDPWEFTDQEAWPDGNTEPRVYFAASPKSAIAFTPDTGYPVLLRIHKDDHQLGREQYTGDMFSTEPVAPSKLQVLGEDDDWHPLVGGQ